MEVEKIWLTKAKKDLTAAKNSLNSGDYEWACFQAQQAVEKALKAIYIKKYKKLLKIHDLVLLARKINAPQEIIDLCKEITPAYVYTRYPDSSFVGNFEEKASKFLNYTKKILKWTEENI